MKKKLYFLAILMCILGGLNMSQIKAQETTVTVGEGAQKSWSVPFDMYNGVGVCQILYTAAELGINETASISSFALNFYGETDGSFNLQTGNPDVDGNFKVYLQNTTISELTSFVEVTGDPYFDGYKVLVNDGWTTFDFNSSFSYNGENLIVTFVDYKGSTRLNWYTFYVDEIEKRCIGSSVEFSTTGLNLSTYVYRPRSQFVVTTGSQPLSLAISPEATSIYSNETATFSASANGGTGSYSFTWSADNGWTANGATATFSSSTVGTYTVTCTVNDGETTEEATATVTVNEVPELSLSISPVTASIYSNETATFSASANGGTGSYNFTWSADNDWTANGATATFSTAEPGTYTITCTVNDGETTATATATVTVEEAPQEIVIGTQTASSSYLPTYTYYGNSLTQQIYTSTEIGINKNIKIKSIAFKDVSGNETSRSMEIYMRNVDINSCTTSSIIMNESELCYNGTVNFVANDWTTITFTTPFEYEAGKNVLLCVVDKTELYPNGRSFAIYNNSNNESSFYMYRDNNKFYATTTSYTPSGYGGIVDQKNCIKLEYEDIVELDPAIPTGLTAAAITSKTVDLSWDAAENAKSYNVYQDGELVSNVQGTSFKVEGLIPSTDYCFTVTSVNITKESGHSEKVCVTTKAPIRPDAPADLEITVNGIAITLTWSEVDNAESYNVYQDGTKISSGITNPTFTIGGLNENTRYCYTVTAVADLESEHSDELCAKTQEMGGGEEEIEEIAGVGSNYNNNLPIYSGATGRYSMSQQYYTKDEINNTGGNITSISYYVYANASLTHNLEIYLNNVDEFGFEVDNMYQSPCRQVSANDLVFEGDVTFPTSEGEWFEINLDKPFLYTGNHILVTVVDNTPSTKGKAFYTRLFEKENCTGYYNSGNYIDPTINSYQMYVITRRNDIRFTFAASAPTIEFINDGDWNTAGNWNTGVVPSTTDDVIIKANATINGDIEVKHLSVEDGSLTIESGSLTVADIMVNNYAEDLIIKDGAQLLQGYDKVKGTFQMNINKPEEWSEWNKTGWQFIASPFTNAAVSQFTDADTYDLYKFDGRHENITEEWRNHKDTTANFETEFVSGRGYMASYQNNTTATLSGTFYAGSSITYPVTYQDIQEGETHWPNFHLLGNPFTFNMDLSNLNMKNMATGVAVVNEVGGYDYMETGTINVGDGFFVKSAAASPSVSYGTRGGNNNVSENISVRVSNSTSRDNVVLNFAGADKVGFPKLNARNEDIAYLYVVDNEERYGIFNYDKDVKEVPLSFEAHKMGNYTISVDAEGEYETIVLVDRQTGIETNMLLEDYNFTTTTSKKENTDRFIVRFTFKSDVATESERFAYQSGDELIIEAEGTVQLFDVTGRMLYIGEVESHGERINVGHLNNAAYILRLVNEEGVKVQKVIIY